MAIFRETWINYPDGREIEAEVSRMGFKAGDSFAVCRYEDGRIASVNDGNGGEDFARSWGPTKFIA